MDPPVFVDCTANPTFCFRGMTEKNWLIRVLKEVHRNAENSP
jgi:hypothetical protein